MIEVACAADETYAPHAAATFHSVLTVNPRGSVRAHFLHSPGLRRETITRLTEMVSGLGGEIAFHELGDEASDGLPAMGRISEVMWYRLALPELLPHTERLLYLDCDTIALAPLAPLWELDLNGAGVGAVTNVFPFDLQHRPEELGLALRDYFNSGVLLMDLEAWREHGWSERILKLARSQPERLVFPDQDALNIELRDRWLALHPRWNCQNAILYLETADAVLGAVAAAEARAHPAILHFEGPAWAKPWHYLSSHPYRHTYLSHRAQTPWPHVRLEGRTAGNFARRHAPSPLLDGIAGVRRALRSLSSR
jgi:lipopolysaccharide biosynthesis glycosyltransferase